MKKKLKHLIGKYSLTHIIFQNLIYYNKFNNVELKNNPKNIAENLIFLF